jgi:hypothetical protein
LGRQPLPPEHVGDPVDGDRDTAGQGQQLHEGPGLATPEVAFGDPVDIQTAEDPNA